MDSNDRGNDGDESLLAYFLPSVKDRECSSQRPDLRASETERPPLHAPSPLEHPNLPAEYQEPEHFVFEYPESEVARSKMINDALQQEDEFLEYLMSLPMSHKFPEVVDEKNEHCELRSESTGHLGAGIGESDDPTPHAMPVSKVGLDHLDNLCKLMEQLGELRDQNSKLQRRVQYLEDLKSLHDMHKQLQDSLENKRRQNQRSRAEDVQLQERFSSMAEQKFTKERVEDDDSRLTVKRHASEESVFHGFSPLSGYTVEFGGGADSKSSSKRKSIPRSRQSFRRQHYRERSRSVGNDDIGETVRGTIKNPRKSVPMQWQRQRRGLVKSKVSKWTKVKEAFRWEKAQLDGCSQRINDFPLGLPESKSQDSGIGLGQRQVPEDRPHDERDNPSQCFLRVKEVEPSASPSDSVLGGGSSSPYHAYSYALSSSSSSSDDLMEIDLNLSSISEAIDIGPQRSASATDSTAEKLLQSAEECSDQRGRRSLSQGQDEDATRRSKSLDYEDIQRPYATFVLDDKGGSISKKSHRTPWGKVKDIIQTRRDSVKKKQKDNGRRDDGTTRTDTEHTTILIDQEEDGDRSGCESTEECGADGSRWHPKVEDGRTEEKRKAFRMSPGSSPRRLTPSLTVTLPSSEELSGDFQCLMNSGHRARDGRCRGYSDCEEQDHRKDAQSQLGEGATETSGTSPPALRRPSKWTKVKKAFLTAKKEVDGTARGAEHPIGFNRVPCYECSARRLSNRSPVSQGLRIYLEGGEPPGVNNEMERLSCTRGHPDNSSEVGFVGTAPSSPAADMISPKTSIQTTQRDIQKNYDELQQKLSQEFHKKLSEWERMKGGWCTVPEGKDEGEDMKKKHSYEWEKSKEKASGRSTAPDESHLPVDFRRRLLEWKRVRASEARPDTMTGRGRGAPGVRSSAMGDDESLPPQFRKRLVEWQLWRAVTGKSDQNVEELHKILPEEFYRKLQEWERIKAETVVPVGVGGGRQFGRGEPGTGGIVMRKDASALGRVVRRMRANEAALGEKWSRQRSEVAREVKHRGKEVQWLEKELQKVEREKLRLEREREKYLEREARLERMRKAMGLRPPGEQEVLIQTSTGFFRFQGISEKFTRKLYEWEKQRGIGPEASTFTLLDPTYRPASASAASVEAGVDISFDKLRSSAVSPGLPSPALPRSRSEGSLAESGGPVHSRSSSLGQVEGKERSRSLEQEVPSRASSEPRMRSETRAILVSEGTDEEDDDEEETAALLVEVEDVEVETAAALEELPTLPSETPIYSYAPEEVTRLIDSSGSESEKECKCYGEASVNRPSFVRTQSSYELIEENMSLINKLKAKENICRELESEIEDLEGKIQDIAKTHQEELERLRREETGLKENIEEKLSVTEDDNTFGSFHGSHHGGMVAQLKQRVNELERCKEQLKQEEENLQTSFQVHAEQQEALAQNLVGKMKLLQEVSKGVGTPEDESVEELGDNEDRRFKQSDSNLNDSQSMAIVQNLSSELLQLAEKLELTLADRNQEIRNLRFELQDRKKSGHSEYKENRRAIFCSRQTRNWSSAEGVHLSLEDNLMPLSDSKMTNFAKTMIPRQSSEELAELPFLLTSKVLQLKKELSNLCSPQEPNPIEPKTSYRRCEPCRGKLQRIPHFQADEDEADSDLKGKPPEKDSLSSWRTKHKVEENISYRPPPRPTTRVIEDKEWAAHCPSKPSFFKGFAERGLTTGVTSKMEVAAGEKLQEPEKETIIAKRGASVGASSGLDSSMGETTKWKGEKMVVENNEDVELQGKVKCKNNDPKGDISKEEDEGTKAHTGDEKTGKEREYILKTRRISDTQVTYDSTKASKVIRNLSRDLLTRPSRATKTLRIPEKSKEGVISKVKGEPIEIESQLEVSKVASECTAPNIFVQTTRKIFTPVCASSKGNDSSNVIGYVEEYLEDSASEIVAPPWRRKNGGLPLTERTTSRPHRPPPELRRGSGESSNRVSHRPDPSSNSPCPHPLPPPSPISARREKSKEAAPSIRLMIAKYDLKQQQQDAGSDGRSPELCSSGGRSPAWLSPTADRRDIFGSGGVKAQMEKYQEEVRKALVGYSTSEAATVQKSASTGIIRSFGLGPCLKPPLHSILKSSSAGAIKSTMEEVSSSQVESSILNKSSSFKKEDNGKNGEDGSIQLNESIEKTLKMLRERNPSPPPSPSRSQKFADIRAMRLKKAKEEFMRSSNLVGSGKEEEAQSRFISNQEIEKQEKEEGKENYNVMDCTTSEISTEISENCSKDEKAAPTKVKVKMRGGVGRGADEPSKEVPEGSRASSGQEGVRGRAGIDARSRHSQISFESESSYEESVTIPEGLIKSASSGMIDLYSHKCKQQATMAKVCEKEAGLGTVLSTSSSKCLGTAGYGGGGIGDGQGTSKLGILSRFRQVKLRTKKMSAISALCRQSLLVSVDKESEEAEAGEREGIGKRHALADGGRQKSRTSQSYKKPLCRSCPSSPIPSSKKLENSGSWIYNPKHVLKAQKDCEENLQKTSSGVLLPSKR